MMTAGKQGRPVIALLLLGSLVALPQTTSTFTVTATDANGITGSKALSITINPLDTSIPRSLHTTFCGPGTSWLSTGTTCTLSAATTAGTWLIAFFLGYSPATGCTGGLAGNCTMTLMSSGGASGVEITGSRVTNTGNGNNSWNDTWRIAPPAGSTTITVQPSTTMTGNLFVWEVQFAASATAAVAGNTGTVTTTTPAGPTVTAAAKTLLLTSLHPGAPESGAVTGIQTPFLNAATGTTGCSASCDSMGFASATTTTAGTITPNWTMSPAATFASTLISLTSNATTPHAAARHHVVIQ